MKGYQEGNGCGVNRNNFRKQYCSQALGFLIMIDIEIGGAGGGRKGDKIYSQGVGATFDIL